ncbi:MAG: MBL fold metallo-hydrolase [Legionellaceae bacterium]|nr:MBL fold metallo-hydrolase [Legionellaceae bacterium]
MKLIFLGVASALSIGKEKYQSNMLLISKSGHKLLIDCGGDIRHSLFALGYSFNDIDAVYISHLHSDHTGGLELFGFYQYFVAQKRPALYISPDQVDRLWNNVLSGGMSSLEEQPATLDTFFAVQPIANQQFHWQDYRFRLVKTEHTFSNNVLLPSYGLLIQGDKQTIFITTDTRLDKKSLIPAYQEADLIFQDCETSCVHSQQHAHYNELKELASPVKAKMWLYDYDDRQLPDASQDGFLGFVQAAQAFEF